MHKEIYETAKEYLIENIGELVSAGDVYYDAGQNTKEDRVLIDVPRAELSRIKNMISGVRIYG